MLDKLLLFHQARDTPPLEILDDLKHAADQIPKHEQAAEAAPLRVRWQKCRRSRRKGPQQLGTLLLGVLARWGIVGLASETQVPGPDAAKSEAST